MTAILALVVLGALAGLVVWSMTSGSEWRGSHHDRDPEPATPEEPGPEASPAEEPVPEDSELVLEPAGSGALPRRRGRFDLTRRTPAAPRQGRRRVRFEDSFDLTVPLEPEGSADGGDLYARAYAPEPPPEHVHIPLVVRAFGALRLVILVALAAGAVALALVGVGWVVTQGITKLVGD